jgi:hypothetical protein
VGTRISISDSALTKRCQTCCDTKDKLLGLQLANLAPAWVSPLETQSRMPQAAHDAMHRAFVRSVPPKGTHGQSLKTALRIRKKFRDQRPNLLFLVG